MTKTRFYLFEEDSTMTELSKQKINPFDYAQDITCALSHGILLNTNGDKFNAMVIGWGGLGVCWGKPVFTVYVRENRYTRAQIDKTGSFTISIPLTGADSKIVKVCGWKSGRDIDKVTEAGLTPVEASVNGVPGVKEYPLTLECKVLYSQQQELEKIPEEIRSKSYPQDVDGFYPMANRDPHTAYIGEIVDSYIIQS